MLSETKVRVGFDFRVSPRFEFLIMVCFNRCIRNLRLAACDLTLFDPERCILQQNNYEVIDFESHTIYFCQPCVIVYFTTTLGYFEIRAFTCAQ